MNGFWRIANRLYHSNSGGGDRLARVFELLSFKAGDNAISANGEIGEGTVFNHRGLGCVTLQHTRIGKNCRIACNVTFGARWSKNGPDGAPVIGDDVVIGAGAVILGNIHIGDGARIGANAVVLNDVPAGAVAVGVPAKIIQK